MAATTLSPRTSFSLTAPLFLFLLIQGENKAAAAEWYSSSAAAEFPSVFSSHTTSSSAQVEPVSWDPADAPRFCGRSAHSRRGDDHHGLASLEDDHWQLVTPESALCVYNTQEVYSYQGCREFCQSQLHATLPCLVSEAQEQEVVAALNGGGAETNRHRIWLGRRASSKTLEWQWETSPTCPEEYTRALGDDEEATTETSCLEWQWDGQDASSSSWHPVDCNDADEITCVCFKPLHQID